VSLTRLEDRQILVPDIKQAGGGQLFIGITSDQHAGGHRCPDFAALAGGRRRGASRPPARCRPPHASARVERGGTRADHCGGQQTRFADTPPARIDPMLVYEGIYIASEARVHRVLRAHGQMNPPRVCPFKRAWRG
jgi:putative transposase